jgi:transaldolase
VPRALPAQPPRIEPRALSAVAFRTQLNDNAMASEKLAEGIRLFVADSLKLQTLLPRVPA